MDLVAAAPVLRPEIVVEGGKDVLDEVARAGGDPRLAVRTLSYDLRHLTG